MSDDDQLDPLIQNEIEDLGTQLANVANEWLKTGMGMLHAAGPEVEVGPSLWRDCAVVLRGAAEFVSAIAAAYDVRALNLERGRPEDGPSVT